MKHLQMLAIAAVILAAGMAGADTISGSEGTLNGVVVPDHVYGKQPFTFAVPQPTAPSTAEPVDIETISGVVVQSTSTDKYGRVFLAAGLAAGEYLITAAGKQVGRIQIAPKPADAPALPRMLQLKDPPDSLRLHGPSQLRGQGFSPNFHDMEVELADGTRSETPLVLAATEDQLKLAPVSHLALGEARLVVHNQATGQHTLPVETFLFDVKAHMEKTTLRTTEQTQISIDLLPASIKYTLRLRIVSGPVHFAGGGKEVETTVQDGHAVFRLLAEGRGGPFNLVYDVAPRLAEGK